MATIGSLIVNVSANLSPFQKGMAKGSKEVRSFASSISGTQKLVAGFGAAIAGSFVVRHIEQTMQAMEDTALAAQRMGVGVDSYIQLGHAAKMANVEQETLTKSLDIYLKKLGGGQLKKPLAALGLSSSAMETTDTITALGMIADKIAALPTPAAKAAAATQLFGKAGQQLLPLFMEGSQGIRAAAEEANRLGIVFDDVAAARIMAANDAMDRMKIAGTGLVQSLAIGLAPGITFLADEMARLTSNTNNSEAAMDKMASNPTWGEKFADTLDAASDSATIAGKFFTDVLPATIDKGGFFLGDRWEQFQKEADAILAGKTPSEKAAIARLLPSGGGATAGGDDAAMPNNSSAFAGTQAKRANDFFSLIDSTINGLLTPQEIFNKKIADLNKLLGVGAIGWEFWARGIEQANAELDKATEKVEEVAEMAEAPQVMQAPTVQGAGAFERGSVAAFSASNQANIDRLNATLQKQQLAVEQQQLKAQQALVAESRRQTAAVENVAVLDVE